MNIDYELYKVFYEVVLNGSISKASESMYISQPAVTQSIKNLEEKLGGKLLIRTKKGIVLTEEGKVLFDYIKKGVENFKNGENAFLNYQYKTAKIFEADIDGVGKNLIKHFKNDKDWSDYNWSANYKNTFFDIDVTTNIKSSFLLSS